MLARSYRWYDTDFLPSMPVVEKKRKLYDNHPYPQDYLWGHQLCAFKSPPKTRLNALTGYTKKRTCNFGELGALVDAKIREVIKSHTAPSPVDPGRGDYHQRRDLTLWLKWS